MNRLRLLPPLLVAAACLVPAAPALAALVTVTGTHFDLTYDDTKLGLFGAPTLVGDSLFFTFSGFAASSLDGAGTAVTNSTVSGLVLTAKDGYQFGALSLAEFGDYILTGSGSVVQVQGQLRAFNVANSIFTQTTSALQVSGATPLTLADGQSHDWVAGATIDAGTAPVPTPFGPSTNVILSQPGAMGVTIENILTAYTDAQGSGPRTAFVEKKFAGVQLDVKPLTPVPLPAAAWLLAIGLVSGAAGLRRRRWR